MVHFQELYEVAVCDVCERPRAHGSHRRCSRIRQRRYARGNESGTPGRLNSSGSRG